MRYCALVLTIFAACARAAENDPPDSIVFRFTPPPGAPSITSIAVPGTFNDWSVTATPMTRQPGGSWRASIRRVAGEQQYKFHINGAWIGDMCRDSTWGDPASDYRVHDAANRCADDGNNGRNAVADFGSAPVAAGTGPRHDPTSSADVSVAGGRLSIRFRASTGQVRGAHLVAAGDTIVMERQLAFLRQEVWRATAPEATPSYTIDVETATGRVSLGPFRPPADPFRAVPWVSGAVGYQIFPDRFQNGDRANDSLALSTDEYRFLHRDPPVLSPWNGPVTERHCCHQYFGGDLLGVLQRLDHLSSLGVTLIYLNPIVSAGSAHGYDTWDYLALEPSIGDESLLRRLLREARARGMRVMWDFVPNHVGIGHPAFRDAVSRGTASPHWSWFTFKVPVESIEVGSARHYDTFAGVGVMPKLNTANPAVREHLMTAVRKWTTFGFAGIRVDVPNEVTDREAFFREFRRTAKAIDSNLYLVGEIWRRAPDWVRGDQFDALMNYAVGQSVVERFARGDMSGAEALAGLSQVYAEYPEASLAMSFNVISTHDNARLLTKLGGGGLGATASAEAKARQRLASAMLYSLPGVPVTFQGDECAFLGTGGSGTREENRYPMQWASCDREMLAHYRELGRLRTRLRAFASPAFRLWSGEGAVVAFLRGETGQEQVLAIFNAGESSAEIDLPTGSWTDAMTREAVTRRASVGSRGWRYLERS
jgi:glycosidase